MHCAAVRALGAHPGVSIAVLVDGEEEIGSPTLPSLLAEHRERLSADVLVLADSTNWRVGVPALTTSLRGGVNVVVEVRTLRHACTTGCTAGRHRTRSRRWRGCSPPATPTPGTWPSRDWGAGPPTRWT